MHQVFCKVKRFSVRNIYRNILEYIEGITNTQPLCVIEHMQPWCVILNTQPQCVIGTQLCWYRRIGTENRIITFFRFRGKI